MTGMHKGVTDVPLCIGQSIKRKKEGTFPPIFNSLTHTTAVSLFFLAVVVRERKWRGACMRKFLHKLSSSSFFLLVRPSLISYYLSLYSGLTREKEEKREFVRVRADELDAQKSDRDIDRCFSVWSSHWRVTRLFFFDFSFDGSKQMYKEFGSKRKEKRKGLSVQNLAQTINASCRNHFSGPILRTLSHQSLNSFSIHFLWHQDWCGRQAVDAKKM